MALQTQLKAPNGRAITLPTGLFINNEFVAGTASQKITSVSPAYEDSYTLTLALFTPS